MSTHLHAKIIKYTLSQYLCCLARRNSCEWSLGNWFLARLLPEKLVLIAYETQPELRDALSQS